ncbi:MAG: bifunctional ornithine acetyltransferase/N-acetylglutamate synthase [Verrucomicrobia bacterium]|nr:bifunctional ornithine acetyltransferase/N-acetylglutamate synthase [Verrucomicrobiota bacterium]
MLAFLATDAALAQPILAALLRDAVDDSFNAITVDGDMSTNDTVLLLANGASGIDLGTAPQADALKVFSAALRFVCGILAEQIVGDGEKITKVVDIRVSGARSRTEAEKAARAIGNSLLVKSSWFGNDPNWGRLLDAVGYSGAEVVVPAVKLFYQDSREDDVSVAVFADGLP